MNDFDIPKEEALEILENMIIPQIVGGISPQDVEEAFVLGGQPGSGKSSFAREFLKTNGNVVFINGDDLRAYHPKYYFYLKENDIEAADMTQTVCNFWIESLIQECIKRGLSFIVEGTMRKKEIPLRTALMSNDVGYSVNLIVISAPYELSLLSLEYRYKELKRLGAPARFTKKESHDESFRNIENTLLYLINSRLFKRFFVYKRYLDRFAESVFEQEQKENFLQDFREGRMRLVEKKEKDGLLFINENSFSASVK